MCERLEKLPGTSSETGAPVRPTELVIDGAYIDKALAMLADAKHEVRICAYDWRWYENEPEIEMQRLNVALLTLIKNNVKIFILVDKSSTQIELARHGFNARRVDSSKMLHTKAICVDAKSLVIGSHNLTKRAGNANYEMSLITQEFEPIAQFCEYFNKMWASRA